MFSRIQQAAASEPVGVCLVLSLWTKGYMLHFCSQADKSPAWLLPPLAQSLFWKNMTSRKYF